MPHHHHPDRECVALILTDLTKSAIVLSLFAISSSSSRPAANLQMSVILPIRSICPLLVSSARSPSIVDLLLHQSNITSHPLLAASILAAITVDLSSRVDSDLLRQIAGVRRRKTMRHTDRAAVEWNSSTDPPRKSRSLKLNF